MKKKGHLIVVSGFAGSGKGTLMKLLFERYDEYVLSISATTRAPRPGEEEGVHYFFKSREEFEKMISENEFLEHAEYVGNYYGTPRSFVEKNIDEGRNVILEIDIQGALNIKKAFPDTIMLFVTPPSAQILHDRLVGRGTETPEVINRRLARAYDEAGGIKDYDYLIVNDDLDECVEQMHGIIKAAHFSTDRSADFIGTIRSELYEILNDQK